MSTLTARLLSRDAQGKVAGVVWRQNGVDNQARKTSDQPAIEKLVSFERREEMIPMRDGLRLHTLIFTPKDQAELLPILMSRTSYGLGQSNSDGINRRYYEMVKDGYIVAASADDRYLARRDFFHNGAFRQSYGYEYVKAMETNKEGTDVSFDKDAYDWYLGLGALGKITELNAGKFPTWNAFVSRPNYDDYWKARGSRN